MYPDIYIDNSFDTKCDVLCDEQGMRWYPWVGRDYAKAEQKILVLLESHYENKNNHQTITQRNFTQRVISDRVHAQTFWKNEALDRLNTLLCGREIQPQEAHLLWERVCFCEFVQRPMNKAKKEQPTHEDFAQGWAIFPRLLEVLRPDFCVCAGMAFANHQCNFPVGFSLKNYAWKEKFDSNNTRSPYIRTPFSFCYHDLEVPAVIVQHPSKIYGPANLKKWRDVLIAQAPAQMQYLMGPF